MEIPHLDWITNTEARALVLALARGQGVFTEEDVLQVLDWVERVLVEAATLRLALAGRIGLVVKDGAVHFTTQPAPPQEE